MADINSRTNLPDQVRSDHCAAQTISDNADTGPTDQSLICGPHDEMVNYAELLFFAYRDFTTDADAILLEYGFGRAHHRVLHFVSRNPGLRVADLLEILKITKQSLARVLKQLLDEEIVNQKAGTQDRRERRLYATAQGLALVKRLSDLQGKRINDALAAAGPDADAIVKKFLFAMIKQADRSKVEAYFNLSDAPGNPPSTNAARDTTDLVGTAELDGEAKIVGTTELDRPAQALEVKEH